MLYIIGLGLGDADDVTLKGAAAIEKSSHVFLEMYTSILGIDNAELVSQRCGKRVPKRFPQASPCPVPALSRLRSTARRSSSLIAAWLSLAQMRFLARPRQKTSLSSSWGMRCGAWTGNRAACATLSHLRPPLRSATTHMDLFTRAVDMGIKVEIIHNASIMNACAACGLQLYSFGQTISIPFFTDEWRPDSFYEKLAFNASGGLHTLCLLDIKVKEPDFKALMKGRTAWLPPRYMTVNTAVEQLLEIETRLQGEGKGGVLSEDSKAFGLARVGQKDQLIVAGTLKELLTVDFGKPLHSLAIAGHMHEMEEAMYNYYHISKVSPPLLSTSAAAAAAADSDADSVEPDFYS